MGTTTVTRRTQKERSDVTRAAILDATIRCLIDLGYAATSTTAIQKRAGVSRGALTHQFPSKHELMIAAVRHLSEVRTSALLDHLEEAPPDDERLEWALRERELGRHNRTKLAPLVSDRVASHPNFNRALDVVIRQMRGTVLTNLIRRDPLASEEIVEECALVFRNLLEAQT
jgi:AcrR family transcriptional regulator